MEYTQPLAEDKEGLARKVTAALYGTALQLHPFRSMGCDVFRLEFSDGRKAKILKVPRGDTAELLREQKIMQSLREHGFAEVPELESTQETNPVEDIAYTVMPFFVGGGIWDVSGMPPDRAQVIYRCMGRFVGRLSLLRVEDIEGAWTAEMRLAEAKANPYRAKTEALLADHPRRNARFAELLRFHFEVGQGMDGFVHDDGPQFITDGGDTLAAIDWAGAGAGSSAGDLGAFLFGHHYWVDRQRRLGKPYHPEWRTWFMGGYLAERPLTIALLTRVYQNWLGTFVGGGVNYWAQGIEEGDEWLDFVETEDAGFPDKLLREVEMALA